MQAAEREVDVVVADLDELDEVDVNVVVGTVLLLVPTLRGNFQGPKHDSSFSDILPQTSGCSKILHEHGRPCGDCFRKTTWLC